VKDEGAVLRHGSASQQPCFETSLPFEVIGELLPENSSEKIRVQSRIV
jgi:hypothetical protein